MSTGTPKYGKRLEKELAILQNKGSSDGIVVEVTQEGGSSPSGGFGKIFTNMI